MSNDAKNSGKSIILVGAIAAVLICAFWEWFGNSVYDVYVFPSNQDVAPEYFRGRYTTAHKARKSARIMLRTSPGDWDYRIGKTNTKGDIGSKVTYREATYSVLMK